MALACVAGAATKLWAWRQWRKGGLTAPQWGMVSAHLGVAVFAIGVAMVGGYGVERDVRLVPGNSKASVADAASQTHPIADCRITFDRIDPARGPNYMALAGHFTLACAGEAPTCEGAPGASSQTMWSFSSRRTTPTSCPSGLKKSKASSRWLGMR